MLADVVDHIFYPMNHSLTIQEEICFQSQNLLKLIGLIFWWWNL